MVTSVIMVVRDLDDFIFQRVDYGFAPFEDVSAAHPSLLGTSGGPLTKHVTIHSNQEFTSFL